MSLKNKILELKEQGKPHNEVTELLNCSKSLVSYYCKGEKRFVNSPTPKHNQITGEIKELIVYLFTNCGISLKELSQIFKIDNLVMESFYRRQIEGNYTKLIFPDTSSYSSLKRRRRKLKLLGIMYLGGKCVKCGYCDDIHALQFHHLKDKSFTISHNNNSSWDIWKPELDKCILLCGNCHQKEHSSDSENFNIGLQMFNKLSQKESNFQ